MKLVYKYSNNHFLHSNMVYHNYYMNYLALHINFDLLLNNNVFHHHWFIKNTEIYIKHQYKHPDF